MARGQGSEPDKQIQSPLQHCYYLFNPVAMSALSFDSIGPFQNEFFTPVPMSSPCATAMAHNWCASKYTALHGGITA